MQRQQQQGMQRQRQQQQGMQWQREQQQGMQWQREQHWEQHWEQKIRGSTALKQQVVLGVSASQCEWGEEQAKGEGAEVQTKLPPAQPQYPSLPPSPQLLRPVGWEEQQGGEETRLPAASPLLGAPPPPPPPPPPSTTDTYTQQPAQQTS